MNIKKNVDFILSKIHFVIVPVVICTLLAILVALFSPRHWEASQALFVRDDSIGSMGRGGRFDSVDTMQVSQETILEIAHHPTVLEAALREVGPSKKSFLSRWGLTGFRKSNWPTAGNVEDLAAAISVKSPKGTQFGRTEVIYLSVKAESNEHAARLARAISHQLGERMMKLREDRYGSVADEVENSVGLARRELESSSRKLRNVEKRIGADLADLRTLMNGAQGEGTVRRVLVELEGELRSAKAAYASLERQIFQFSAAANNPDLMMSLPNDLLNNQPGLKRLKEGLVEAQLRTSQLMGARSARHPDVIAAKLSEDRVKKHLHQSLLVAVDGLRSSSKSASRRVANVSRQLQVANARMGGVSSLRTEYSNLAEEVNQRVEFLKLANQELAVARGNELSARSVSLIHLVDQPIVGTRPLGPGRVTTVIAGAMAGLLIGGSLIFLMLPVNKVAALDQVDLARLNRHVRNVEQYRGGFAAIDHVSSSLTPSGNDRRGARYWSNEGRRMYDHPGCNNITAGRRNSDLAEAGRAEPARVTATQTPALPLNERG